MPSGPDKIVYFGDSLTDNGNVFELTSRAVLIGIPPADAGYAGAFSNGPVHADVTPQILGAEAENYAMGGAQALGTQTLEDFASGIADEVPVSPLRPDASAADRNYDFNLGAQVGRFRADAAASPPSAGTAAAFFIGLNDYSNFEPSSDLLAPLEAAKLVSDVVDATIDAAEDVAESGVETVLLYTLPSFRFFPASGAEDGPLLALGDVITQAHNDALRDGAAELEEDGVTAEIVDFNRMTEELRDDPEGFGLDADLFGEPVLDGTGGTPDIEILPDGTIEFGYPANPDAVGADIDTLAFFDALHPTAATHGALGAFAAASLSSDTILRGRRDGDIVEGRGADLILAGGGDDRVRAGHGQDTILSGRGRDSVEAGNANDIVAGGRGDDRLLGNRGADVIADGRGDDRAYGGKGADLLVAGLGSDRLWGNLGDDAFLLTDFVLESNPADQTDTDILRGGQGEDTLYFMVSETWRALFETDIALRADETRLDTTGLQTRGIESFVFLDEDADLAESIASPARVAEADLWGFA